MSMTRFRLLSATILLLFAAMVVGVQFHSHPSGQDPLTAHCNSCQVSQAAFDSIDTQVIAVSEIAIPYQAPQVSLLVLDGLIDVRLSRAPPIS
jgi:hypothetical protein